MAVGPVKQLYLSMKCTNDNCYPDQTASQPNVASLWQQLLETLSMRVRLMAVLRIYARSVATTTGLAILCEKPKPYQLAVAPTEPGECIIGTAAQYGLSAKQY